MTTQILLAYFFLIVTPLLTAFPGSIATEEESNVSTNFISSKDIAREKYVIDKKASIVTWKGSMLFAPAMKHNGYVSISKGELMIEKGQLVGGTVQVDMNTITDKNHDAKNELVDHLKSPDFFDVRKFPFSSFAITNVATVKGENVNVTGNLTIKGITQSITFPVKIEVKGGTLNAIGKVVIDRTKWDIRYSSRKFYNSVADQTISDDVEFQMTIVAKK
jgi:polyisoprenoid-binding protein YceI